jgi:rare lipoprotein A
VRRLLLFFLLPFSLASACAPRDSITADPSTMPRGVSAEGEGAGRAPSALAPQEGLATWYGKGLAGHKMANGERFDPSAMTAAHRTLKLGTWVDVMRVDTGAHVRVRITDRGPFGDAERIIDLSRAAADKIGMLKAGVVKVKLVVVDGP